MLKANGMVMQTLLVEELAARHGCMYEHEKTLLRRISRRVNAPAVDKYFIQAPLPNSQAARSIVACPEALPE